jgi:ubiquinone/menaquinone biosynthesis C-methylase UbiE
MLDLKAVDLGFSRKADVYDAYCDQHPVIRWSRSIVRQEVSRRLGPNGSILELNAGTGADAAYFVERGYRVHATDIASGMISAIQQKRSLSKNAERFTVQQLSFTSLDQVTGGPYDLIFSNFGGLNCIPDLKMVAKSMPGLLNPGGYLIWVVMPPVCLWELVQLLRGQLHVATRRFKAGGVMANVEGAAVMTWYHSPKKLLEVLTPQCRLIHRQSLSLFCPPSYMDRFPHRFPRLTQFLLNLDERLGSRFPFNNWGDFIAYTFQYES